MKLPDMQVSYSKCCICIQNGCAAERKVINLPYYGISLCEEHLMQMVDMLNDQKDTMSHN